MKAIAEELMNTWDDIGIGKACGWLSTYLWYNEVFEKFMKIMEEEL